jgi:hypothetical protein
VTPNPFELDDHDAVAVVVRTTDTLTRFLGVPKDEVEESARQYIVAQGGAGIALENFEQIPSPAKGAFCREVIARGLLSDDDFVSSATRAALLSLDKTRGQAFDPVSLILAVGAVSAVVLMICKIEYTRETGWIVRRGPDPTAALKAIGEICKKLLP